MKTSKLFFFGLVIFTAILLVGGIFWVKNNNIFQMEQVQLSMDGVYSQYWQDQFKTLLKSLKKLEGQNTLLTPLKEIESTINSLNWVKSFVIKRRLPNH